MSVEALDLNSSSEDIVTAINDIASVTSQTGIANASDKITNGELAILTSSLKKIATLLPSQLVSNDTVTDRFIGCVDNLIDDTNIDTWKSETDSTSAEQILSAIDSIAEALTVTAEQDEKRLITKKNIAIQAQLLSDGVMVFPDSVESFDQDWINQTKSSIRIQSQSSSNSTEAYVATAVIYRNMSGILPNTYSVTGETISERKDTEKKVKINGPVLAMTIPSHLSRSLDSPITITFEHYNNNLTAPICVFWQYKSDSQGFWSDDGCRNKSTNTSSTVCECDHLTNFAVLMSPFQPVDEVGSSSETMVLHIVSIVGISTSILCLIATFVIHFALWKHLKSERTTLLIHLCVALFVAYIVFLAGINRTENKAACTAIAAFLHYIYLVVFCIMLAEGIQIAMIVLYVFKTKSKLKLLLSIAWGVPAVIVGISVLVTRLNGYGNEKLQVLFKILTFFELILQVEKINDLYILSPLKTVHIVIYFYDQK
ncbi:adhesion G protein-coupled receptor L3-like [Mercenaria mercenaria]|uniref:adhesion G protein-coupled receptor L3-like n=1 Tax=Mercenaria mercenaria TaxID=6596 RepID=UPI00234EA958|nr:adhesion G protein-coupled receptor L3-like [Mercenaria mercenaria]